VASSTAASAVVDPAEPDGLALVVEAPPDGLTLAVEEFGFAWPDAAASTLRSVALELAPGECVWLGGASGSGKTTLLRAIAGLLPEGGAARGRIRTGSRPALLLQNVETQLLATRVDGELDFGLALRGLPEAERRERARHALEALGLAGFGDRAVDDLSAGEKQRVVLAALLALEPGVLLLDEPSSQLDPDGRRRLAECLGALAHRGHAILIADHQRAPWADLVDRCVVIEKGTLVATRGAPEAAAAPQIRPLAADATTALAVEGLRLHDDAGRETLRGISLQVAAGERVHLEGRNGAGKSTLLRAVAGLLQPSAGRVRIAGGAAAPGRVGLLFQNPERNLFERSVADEIAFGLRRLGWSEGAMATRVRDVLGRCGLERLAGCSPLRISFGEQHRVALASLLAPRPALLLLDEPFTGLDLESRGRVLELLDREQATAGFGLLVASHDPPPAARWAHRRLSLVDGRLEA
jgi:energy-coupling factor transporter ATP-binding protein EcfA2